MRAQRLPGPAPAAAPRRRPRPHRPAATQLPADADALRDGIIVAGGGPAGLSAAVALQRVGIPALVLERDAAPQPGASAGRGSALGLWTNAWRALDVLGAGAALRSVHPRMKRVQICRQDGRELRSFSLAECDGGPHEFRGVQRSTLVDALAAQLRLDSVAHSATLQVVRPAPGGGCEAVLASGQVLRCAAVIGADGVRSAAAAAAGRSPANYVGQVAIRGIARYADPADMPCDVIRQVWGDGPRAGCYPLSPTELYWFVCFNAAQDAPIPPSPEAVRAEAAALVEGWAWGLGGAVGATAPEDVSRSKIADRWDMPPAASRWRGGLAVTLAGDALHPMTPNLGQGGCTALEDGVVLARTLAEAGVPALLALGGGRSAAAEALGAAFAEYERARAARCLPLTVRSYAMGALLQAPLPPVVAARDAFVSKLFSPGHFLDHAAFDCGALSASAVGGRDF